MRLISPFLLVLALLPALPTRAQAGGNPPTPAPVVKDDRPRVKSSIDSLEMQLKDPKRDTASLAALTALTAQFEPSGPKDRARIVKSVAGILNSKREDKGFEKVRCNAAEQLGMLGPESQAAIVKAFTEPPLRKNSDVLNALARSLVKLDTKDSLDVTIGLLADKELRVASAAMTALGDLETKPSDVRKRAFFSILDRVNLHPLVGDPIDSEKERQRVEQAAEDGATKSLERLSGHTEKTVPEWLAWWVKNKGVDWPAKG